MGLDSRILMVGIIVVFFTAMMPFSAIVILSIGGSELMVLGMQEMLFYLGWLINPIIMIVTAIIIMRVSRNDQIQWGVLAGIIMALTYTLLIMIIHLSLAPEGMEILPFSGIELPIGYFGMFLELVIKAYAFCIAGGIVGALSMRGQATSEGGQSAISEM